MSKRFAGATIAILLASAPVFAIAQEPAGLIDEDALVSEPLSLESLPKPPLELQPWLKAGNVQFLSGGRRPSTVTGTRSTGAAGQRFDAETKFRLSYEFSSRCRWWWRDDRLLVRVTYRRLGLSVSHEVWFRQRPTDLNRFWESSLVLHEFDHIRLSSDPRVLTRFKESVRENNQLEFDLAEVRTLLDDETIRPDGNWSSRQRDSRLKSDQVRRLVNARVREHFDRTVQLLEIRYQELDRVTGHGARPVPETGRLREWLTLDTGDSSNTDEP